jgi:hypothetical protein
MDVARDGGMVDAEDEVIVVIVEDVDDHESDMKRLIWKSRLRARQWHQPKLMF